MSRMPKTVADKREFRSTIVTPATLETGFSSEYKVFYLGPRTWGCGTAADGGILVVLVAVKQKTPLHNTCKRDETHSRDGLSGSQPATRAIPEVLTMLPRARRLAFTAN